MHKTTFGVDMEKNASAAPARKGGKASKQGAPAAGAQNPLPPDTSTGGQVLQADTSTGGQDLQADTSTGGLPLQAGQQGQAGGQLPQQHELGSTDLQQGEGSDGTQSLQAGAADSGASADKKSVVSPPSIYGLEVTSRQEGFRRAGRAWSTTPTVIEPSEITEEQARQLAAEPMLACRVVLLPAGEEA
jgi:hypothetical protein